MKTYDLSLVIACYQEEGHLRESVQEIEKTLSQTHYQYEIVFVDDCSLDRTREIILELCEDKPHFRYIFHQENTGRGGAVTDGILSSQARFVGFIDIDLEVHCRYIPAMLRALEEETDIATAHRIYTIKLNPIFILRHFLSVGYRKIVRSFLGIPYLDTETGFKFFNREKILPILKKTQNKGWFWDTEIMVLSYQSRLKVIEIPCLFIRRVEKKSTVRLFRDSLQYLVDLYHFKKEIRNRNLELGDLRR